MNDIVLNEFFGIDENEIISCEKDYKRVIINGNYYPLFEITEKRFDELIETHFSPEECDNIRQMLDNGESISLTM